MAGWGFINQRPSYRDLDDEVLMMGLVGSLKPAGDLLRNCDLPPPLKVFSGSANRVIGCDEDDGFRRGGSGGEDEKLELLKALRLSQTRAREAERKAAKLAKERDVLADALVRDSMSLMAHRQWVRLLEVQVKRLELQWMASDKAKGDPVRMTWMVALALCLGIAGVGLAVSFTYIS